MLRFTDTELEVVAASQRPENPFKRGQVLPRDPALYCETTIANRRMLLVPDATADPAWRNNPCVAQGLVAYVGYPLEWPDARIFGTLCVLDTKPNAFSGVYMTRPSLRI